MVNYLLNFIQRIGYGFGFGLGMSFAWKINSIPQSTHNHNIPEYKTHSYIENTNKLLNCSDK